jgi:hypothetical protein
MAAPFENLRDGETMEVALGSIDEQKKVVKLSFSQKRSTDGSFPKKRSSTFRGRENGPPLSNFLGTPLRVSFRW